MADFWKELVLLYIIIYLSSRQIQGVLVGESDLTVQEGSSRQIFVRRSGSQPLNITVFATTIEDYREFQLTASDHECGVILTSLIGPSESQVDPAEANDLLVREYPLAYGTEEQEKSLILEVTDDSIAENEEIFILYTSFTESPNDRCATAVRLHDNDVVQFNFSTASISIREDEDLPSRLSIVKTGLIEPNITFQVYVYPGEGSPNENDFIANSGHMYMFTNKTNELPIVTEIVDDLMAEYNEVIIICLPNLQNYTMAEPTDPSCVRVTINDNDPVVIGFSNSTTSVVLTEGSLSIRICIELKQGGFPLYPNGHLELTIQTESIEGEVEYGDERLQFDSSHFTSCKRILARDDRISDGTHTSMLTIGMASWSSVPVIMSPGRIPIVVYDNDITAFDLILNTDTNQGAHGSQASPIVQEGVRVQNLIRIRKRGYTTFAYNVILNVQSLTEPEDTSFILNTTVRFQESTSEVNIADIPINILDDSVPEKQRQFSVSVLRIDPLDTDFSTGSKMGALTEFGRESISITVFDNDFNVGFVNESVAVTPGGSARLSICVAILEPKSPDIDPTRRIPILVSTANASTDVLQFETNEITLSATNAQVCIAAVIQSECENTTEFTIELHWISDPLYKVNFQRRNLNITCHQQATTGVCQSCIDKGGVSPRTPIDEMVIGIVISVLVVSVIVLIIIVSVIAVRRLCLRGIGTKPNRNQGHDTS